MISTCEGSRKTGTISLIFREEKTVAQNGYKFYPESQKRVETAQKPLSSGLGIRNMYIVSVITNMYNVSIIHLDQ